MTKHESIFISHDSVEAAAAAAIRSALTELGLHAFVASENLQPGSRWEESIRGALRDCTACLVLCSERSLASEWVWMEFGAATVVAPDRVVPVLLPGLDRDRVPSQFRPYQYIVLDAPEGCQELAAAFGASLPDGGEALYTEIRRALDWRRIRPGRALRSVDGPGFLVDLSHGQGKWPTGREMASVFDGFGRLPGFKTIEPGEVHESAGVSILGVGQSDQLYRGHLSDWSGLVVTCPLHTTMRTEIIDEIVAWVHHGGRLLLLGFEYGDRHHGANLRDLASRFGLRLNTDIVAASRTIGEDSYLDKPYDQPVIYSAVLTDHPLVAGVRNVALTNAQSVGCEPGGQQLIATGDNLIAEPDPRRIRYVDGRFVGTSDRCISRGPHPWLGVLTLAPRALTGKGEVVAMGTWLLADEATSQSTDNDRYAQNLIDWLGAS